MVLSSISKTEFLESLDFIPEILSVMTPYLCALYINRAQPVTANISAVPCFWIMSISHNWMSELYTNPLQNPLMYMYFWIVETLTNLSITEITPWTVGDETISGKLKNVAGFARKLVCDVTFKESTPWNPPNRRMLVLSPSLSYSFIFFFQTLLSIQENRE